MLYLLVAYTTSSILHSHTIRTYCGATANILETRIRFDGTWYKLFEPLRRLCLCRDVWNANVAAISTRVGREQQQIKRAHVDTYGAYWWCRWRRKRRQNLLFAWFCTASEIACIPLATDAVCGDTATSTADNHIVPIYTQRLDLQSINKKRCSTHTNTHRAACTIDAPC